MKYKLITVLLSLSISSILSANKYITKVENYSDKDATITVRIDPMKSGLTFIELQERPLTNPSARPETEEFQYQIPAKSTIETDIRVDPYDGNIIEVNVPGQVTTTFNDSDFKKDRTLLIDAYGSAELL